MAGLGLSLDANAKKYLGYGLIATGVLVGGYGIYSFMKKKKGSKSATNTGKALNGLSKKGKKKLGSKTPNAKKSKKTKKITLK